MKKPTFFAMILTAAVLALCLAGTPSAAEEDDFSDIAGVWYAEDATMTVTEEGRFAIESIDGDWTGSLKAERRLNEEEEEYAAYVMTPDDPELSTPEKNELTADVYHPGKLTLVQDGTPRVVFRNVPVSVADVGEEDLTAFEPYAFVDGANGEEPAVTMMFTFLRPAKDVAVTKLENQQFDENGEFICSGVSLDWWPELDSLQRVVVTYVFEGDLPELSISFAAENEIRYEYAVMISGADGELDFMEIPAGEG